MFSRGEIKVSDIPASLIEVPLVADVRGQDKMQDRIWLSPTDHDLSSAAEAPGASPYNRVQ